ncbi:uncharacterized protein LOC117108722 [Anneissia japonica]|uniref:uncharacterized protein LOC117108722 n=1 Tax=Anneissia japonica TaxID=1529436 RepID=UPI0014258BBB|nr:uncharacterized protein LOC117108722 [Anneissia japonica]
MSSSIDTQHSILKLLNTNGQDFDTAVQHLERQDLELLVRSLQDAIARLQREYKRLSQTAQADDGQATYSQLSMSKQRLVELCKRNRRCLSKLMAEEWDNNSILSDSGSVISEEYTQSSGDFTTSYQDSDDSEISPVEEIKPPLHIKKVEPVIKEEPAPVKKVGPPTKPKPKKFVVADLKFCQDFVNNLAAEVTAMQVAMTKKDEPVCSISKMVSEKDNETIANESLKFTNGSSYISEQEKDASLLRGVNGIKDGINSLQLEDLSADVDLPDVSSLPKSPTNRSNHYIPTPTSTLSSVCTSVPTSEELQMLSGDYTEVCNDESGNADNQYELPKLNGMRLNYDACVDAPLSDVEQAYQDPDTHGDDKNGYRSSDKEDSPYQNADEGCDFPASDHESTYEKPDNDVEHQSGPEDANGEYENVRHETDDEELLEPQSLVVLPGSDVHTNDHSSGGESVSWPDNEYASVLVDNKYEAIERKSLITLADMSIEEHPMDDAIYRYDGPIKFDGKNKGDKLKLEEKDNVKKWDPVPLLKDIFTNVQRRTPLNPHVHDKPTIRSEIINMEGYMEKLPMGRRRASFIKKWKKRYFRAKEGNLFYYEDHKARKSLGYIQLIGGRVNDVGSKALEVTDTKGRVLLLRCGTKTELEDWRKALIAEAKDSGGIGSTLSRRYTKPVVIIDLGSSAVRAGVLTDDNPTPQLFFPCVVATNKKQKDHKVYGFDALHPDCRAASKVVYPLKPLLEQEKFTLNLDVVEGLLNYIYSELKVDPIAFTTLLITPFNFGKKTLEKLAELLFERFHVEGCFIQEQALMALYSYKATSGVVVNVGERIDIVPIVDGYIVEGGVSRLPFGGRQITEHLTRLLTEQGHRYFSDVESYISRYIKEKACFVAQNYQAELQFCSVDSELCSTLVDLDRYNVPDGFGHVRVDNGRFRSTEGLFHPELWGKDHPGLHLLVAKSIKACGIDNRKHMCRSIYLSGGSTKLPGLAGRLKGELLKIFPKSATIKVHAAQERYHAAYNGATILAPLSVFDTMSISKEEWRELGPTSITKWLGD